MNGAKYVPTRSIDTRLQNERLDTLRANLKRGNRLQSVQDSTSEIIDSPDIAERKNALEACSWMSEEQKSKVSISEKGITIQGIGTLTLNDEPNEMNYDDAVKVGTASKDNWEAITNFIGGSIQQKLQFFRQVLKMDKIWYWSSSALDHRTARTLLLLDDYVGTDGWNIKNIHNGVRAFKNF